MPQLDQWFVWRDNNTAVLPNEWRQQPLKQLVINRTLDFIEHTWRLYNQEGYSWSSSFNGTQLELVGWMGE